VSDERGLRIRLLGNLAASYDGVAVDLGGPQQRAVLAMLVLYRDRGLSDDRIVEYLWADQSGRLTDRIPRKRAPADGSGLASLRTHRGTPIAPATDRRYATLGPTRPVRHRWARTTR
jgi:hypothetical protein